MPMARRGRVLQGLAATQFVLASLAQVSVPPEFQGHLRCPFAKVWLEYGPEKAAEILQVPTGHGGVPGRRLADEVVWGTCNYNNPFAGPMCMELRGATWTEATAGTRCNAAFMNTAGTLTKGARCPTDATLGGWCMTAGGTEATLSKLMPPGTTCQGIRNTCETMARGTFEPAGQCLATGTTTTAPAGASSGPVDPLACRLAPGPIGAAHQLGSSTGYGNNCPDTPAQLSPYMWPARWVADMESKSLKAGSDEVQYEARGRVWYMLDKNWKRMDLSYQRGVQRGVGQRPCAPEEREGAFGCVRNRQKNSTMIHRQTKMFFIDWSDDGSTMTNCTWLDLSVIGNVRPDWYMDDRGDSTDVQYLGDSHVFYMDQPRLVKQWRKKDFASQYFTMSVQRLPGADGVHWPLILNIPGEGFGDDALQHYYNHRVLNASETAHFMLDQQYEATGAKCIELPSSTSGPPTGQQAVVPSNLEVEPVSWRKAVWTGSPVWTPPAATGPGELATGVLAIGRGGTAEACFDASASLARVTLSLNVSRPVWAAVGFLKTEECLMTPRGGIDGEAVFAEPSESGAYTLSFGTVPPALKNFSADAKALLGQRLVPLAQATGFRGGNAQLSSGTLRLTFARSYPAKPTALHLSFAQGGGSAIGYHTSRGCFSVTNMPACPAAPSSTSSAASPGTFRAAVSALALALATAVLGRPGQ